MDAVDELVKRIQECYASLPDQASKDAFDQQLVAIWRRRRSECPCETCRSDMEAAESPASVHAGDTMGGSQVCLGRGTPEMSGTDKHRCVYGTPADGTYGTGPPGVGCLGLHLAGMGRGAALVWWAGPLAAVLCWRGGASLSGGQAGAGAHGDRGTGGVAPGVGRSWGRRAQEGKARWG